MKSGYDRIAWLYDRLAKLIFGKSIIQSQTFFLNQLKTCNTVLVLGGGTGWWLDGLLDRFPHLQITFIDSSSEMIRQAKHKLIPSAKVRFINGTIASLTGNDKFDGVVLHYFLDQFSEEQLPKELQQIVQWMNSKSIWLVSDFVNQKKWHSVFLQWMYLFFNLVTDLKTKRLPDWEKHLERAGLREIEKRSFYRQFIHAVVYQLS